MVDLTRDQVTDYMSGLKELNGLLDPLQSLPSGHDYIQAEFDSAQGPLTFILEMNPDENGTLKGTWIKPDGTGETDQWDLKSLEAFASTVATATLMNIDTRFNDPDMMNTLQKGVNVLKME